MAVHEHELVTKILQAGHDATVAVSDDRSHSQILDILDSTEEFEGVLTIQDADMLTTDQIISMLAHSKGNLSFIFDTIEFEED